MDNRFVIKAAGIDVVSVADVPAGAEYLGVIIDALRTGKQVDYQRAGEGEPIKVKPAPVKALKSAEPASVKHPRRRRLKPPTPAAPATPTKAAVALHSWNKGDIVFLAWSKMSKSQRAAYDDMRESMGTVEGFRRGTGIRRTVGVKFDTSNAINWFTPDELSDKCEFCIKERAGQPGESAIEMEPA